LAALPAPPGWLSAVGQREYFRVGNDLGVTAADVGMLITYAAALDRLHEAETELAVSGAPLTAMGSTGSMVTHPLVKIARDASDRARKALAALRPNSVPAEAPAPDHTKSKFHGLLANVHFDASIPPWQRWGPHGKANKQIREGWKPADKIK
jgi:hypothetical protein